MSDSVSPTRPRLAQDAPRNDRAISRTEDPASAPLEVHAALLADDHTLFREGMAFLLRDIAPRATIWQADGLDAALEILAGHPEIELFLIDLAMPGMGGPGSIRAVRDAYPGVRVVVLSGSEGVETVSRSLAAGAAGYIPKSAEKDIMAAALHQVMRGQVYVPPLAAGTAPGTGSGPPVSDFSAPAGAAATTEGRHQVAGRTDGSEGEGSGLGEIPADGTDDGSAEGVVPPTIGRLTPRQREVLKCLAQGKSNKEIARELNLAEGTVKIHMEAILKGLNARNRTQAVVIAARMKLA